MSEDRPGTAGSGQAPVEDAVRFQKPSATVDNAGRSGGDGAVTDALPIAPRGSTALDEQTADGGAARERSDHEAVPHEALAREAVPHEAVAREAVPHDPAPREGPTARAVPPRPQRYDPRPTPPVRPASRRRARLAITRVDPWSVFVLSLLVSIFLGIVLIVAIFVLYGLLDSLGVLSSLNRFASDLQIIDAGQSLVTKSQVLGVAAVLAAVDVVLLTVLATLAAFLYNLCASLTGGIEVALSERE